MIECRKRVQLSEIHLDDNEALPPILTAGEVSNVAKLRPNTEIETDPEEGLFALSISETSGTKNEIWTADECTDTTEMTTETDGNNIFAAILQETELSDFHELIKHAVRPTFTELEVLLDAKLRPRTLAKIEPDEAETECSVATIDGEFQE